ncbi:MAG TPA: hypothetical protein VF727_13865 [Allosphingosinicella sp.]|jgi:hypothetical protein
MRNEFGFLLLVLVVLMAAGPMLAAAIRGRRRPARKRERIDLFEPARSGGASRHHAR